MSVFITGTDTDVGKTVVSTLACIRWGYKYWKPVQSGLALDTDSDFVGSYIGKENVLPERFRLNEPLSPHHAAEMDGIEIHLEDFDLPSEKSMVVEGAGGVLVPLNEKDMVIDLMAKFGLPVLVVARSGLGTLNHTLMTLETLRARELSCAGIILVGEANPRNKKTLQEFSGVNVLAEIPWLNSLDSTALKRAAQLLPETPPTDLNPKKGDLSCSTPL